MDVNKIREDFPIFQRPPLLDKKQGPFVYLDNAATTHKPQVVINTLTQFYAQGYATVHRALYDLGEMATTAYESARTTVARFINAKTSQEIIFTKGATEGINFVAHSWALQNLGKDDEILLTEAEHHANLLPWQQVAEKTGARLVFIPINSKTFMLESPHSYITPKTKLIAVAHASNVLGQIWQSEHELKLFICKAHETGAKVLLDGAQSIAHHKIDIQKLNPDFFVFSGHKIFAPTGIGVLYIKKDLHDNVQPYQVGGSMIFSASYHDATWAKSPQKFEAGTPPIAGALGLRAALEYLEKSVNFATLQKHEAALCGALIDGLEKIDGLTIVGNQENIRRSGHMVCFALENIHPHDLASLLGSYGIAVRAGHHCAQPLVSQLGFPSLIRVSVAAYNTQEDIEQFLHALSRAINLLQRTLI